MMETTYRNLIDFLSKHRAKDLKKPFTHTRIPSEEHNVYGGSYHIDKSELTTYYNLYYDYVFNRNNMEHLTEKQLPDAGPILIDLDFRYSTDIDTRPHDENTVRDIVQEYLLQIKEFLKFNDGDTISIYVMEKSKVNVKENVTKDGIHIIIGIHMDKLMKIILREKMLTKLSLVLASLKCTNTIEDIIDIGIAQGVVNWPMYGSRKPGNEPYVLEYKLKAVYSEEDNDFDISNEVHHKRNDFPKLSAQYDGHPRFEINPNFSEEYKKRLEKMETESKPKKKSSSNVINKILLSSNLTSDNTSALAEITNQEELDSAITSVMSSLNPNEYIVKELHDYTQILPEKYYRAGGSHLLNRQVAFGLKNKDERLFLSWVKLRSKSSDFSYSDIPRLYDEWCNFDKKDNGITYRSIIYWAKQDSFEEYENVKKNTIDYYIDNTMFEAGDWDYATILYYMYKDKFICTNLKNTTWYVFKKNRWEKDDGMSLRKNISTKLFQLYSEKQNQLLEDIQNYEPTDEKHGKLQRKIKQLANICTKFKDSGHKNKIMREASELFFDGEFIKLMDSNPYLLCFENGVYDFKTNEFRQGYPSDYVTKSTGRNYIKYDENNQTYSSIYLEIRTFMSQLFPEEDLCRYMWDHLAAALIGVKREQAFNIYKGSGSNGKSILTELMSLGLGDYKGTVPVNLITDKRSAIGGTTSEIIALKGVRYAVMQELSAGSVLNEGIMKEITSATEPLQGRALWCESETFIPQFSLVVCTNLLPKIKSYEDGTWRRMKVTEFMSKFITEGEIHYHDNNYVFPKDKTLKEKLKNWAPAFVGMLVDIASKTMGEVIDCPQVVASSNKYRESQDCLSKFINTNIIKEQGSGVKKPELNTCFKMWFSDNYGNERMPRLSELDELMTRKFGPINTRTNKWQNIKILQIEEDNEEER
jgi:P4 family phage/plasmid primase-like protien